MTAAEVDFYLSFTHETTTNHIVQSVQDQLGIIISKTTKKMVKRRLIEMAALQLGIGLYDGQLTVPVHGSGLHANASEAADITVAASTTAEVEAAEEDETPTEAKMDDVEEVQEVEAGATAAASSIASSGGRGEKNNKRKSEITPLNNNKRAKTTIDPPDYGRDSLSVRSSGD